MCKGYTQIEEETFAPVARMKIIRMLLDVATKRNYKIFQIDVKFIFLNGELKEEVYIEQPDGFILDGEHLLKLKQCNAFIIWTQMVCI